MDELEPWVAARIEECAPERGLGVPAMQRLMHACAALKVGRGDLFGMSMTPGFVPPPGLYRRACETLQRWIPVLSEHLDASGCEQIHQFVRGKGLDVALPSAAEPPAGAHAEPAPVSAPQVEAAQQRLDALQPLWSPEAWAALVEQWRAVADRDRSGLAGGALEIGEPLDASLLARLQVEMARPIPDDLLRAGLNARHLSVGWSLPTGTPAPDGLTGVCGGPVDGVWSLDHLPAIAEGALDWAFDHLDDDEKRLWTNSVAFGGANANNLALLHGRVVFLHHENDPGLGHGDALAPDLKAFVERWTALACVDPEWLVGARVIGPDGLDPASDLAMRWATFREQLAATGDKPDWLASAFEDDD